MEFDKSRVYTALNADELEVGSKVIVADTLQGLKDRLNKSASDENYTIRIGGILPETEIHRFKTSLGNNYPLAYLISPPKEPKYKPFSDTETALRIIAEHGGWVSDVNEEDEKETFSFITGVNTDCHGYLYILIGGMWNLSTIVSKNFIFADDGTPVGVKVEDDDNDAE